MQVSQNCLLHRNVDFMNCEETEETDKFFGLELEHKDRFLHEINQFPRRHQTSCQDIGWTSIG